MITHSILPNAPIKWMSILFVTSMSITSQPQFMEHLAHFLSFVQSDDYKSQSPHKASGIVKKLTHHGQSPQQQATRIHQQHSREWQAPKIGSKQHRIQNFEHDHSKLQLAGISFGPQFAQKIQIALIELAAKQAVEELRFWGVIRGKYANYYIMQGIRQPLKVHQEILKGSEKAGEGVNYYDYWVSNNPLSGQWTVLPNINKQHVLRARRIKKMFTGKLNAQVDSQPAFEGRESEYLKAQICRITHSSELSPKGIYKVDDDNPKVIEFEEEVKVPDFAELNSLEGWVHRNQMILTLGRCTHWIDSTLSEEQIEATMTDLNENDPEIERLRLIAEDKVPEALNLGIDNPWLLRLRGDEQVFTKEDASLVYGVAALQNVFWPGWVTLGYVPYPVLQKDGFTNFYLGNGLKMFQPSWDQHTNPDLSEDAPQQQQFGQPNPKQQPKPEEPANELDQEADQE